MSDYCLKIARDYLRSLRQLEEKNLKKAAKEYVKLDGMVFDFLVFLNKPGSNVITIQCCLPVCAYIKSEVENTFKRLEKGMDHPSPQSYYKKIIK